MDVQQLTEHSYLRQRNSLSRIQVTKSVFQHLVDECNIFPKFVEHVMDIRYKIRETEVGPPPMRLQFLPNDGYGAHLDSQ